MSLIDVSLLPHDPAWTARFEAERAALMLVCGAAMQRIHHIARHLAFRDYLLAHRRVAGEYAALKASLVATGVDWGGYCDGKAGFVAQAECAALRWAARQGAVHANTHPPVPGLTKLVERRTLRHCIKIRSATWT